MDAKTACELIKNAYTIITADCEKYMLEEGKQVIKFIKQQEKDAEMGRAALEAINKVNRRLDPSANPTVPCGFDSPIRRDWYNRGEFHELCHKCNWYDFCRLRAEGEQPELSKEPEKEDCPNCGGCGLIDDNQLWTCPECNGTGKKGAASNGR